MAGCPGPGTKGTGGDKCGQETHRPGTWHMGASKNAGTGSAKVRTLHIGGREACRSPHESPASPPAAGPPPASSLRADPPLSWTALANTSRPNHSAAALVLRASRILCHPGAVCARNRLGRATRRLVLGSLKSAKRCVFRTRSQLCTVYTIYLFI